MYWYGVICLGWLLDSLLCVCFFLVVILCCVDFLVCGVVVLGCSVFVGMCEDCLVDMNC